MEVSLMDIEILDRFYSKRNNVYKIRIHNREEKEIAIMKNYDIDDEKNIYVMKKYNVNNTDALEKEYKNMEMLQKHGISIPKIIYKSNDSLIFQYIQGELVEDLVEKQCLGNWIDELALWLVNLHKISNNLGNLLKMDVNLRNFIYGNGKIYGLDFEEVGFGDARCDLANICFFILTNKPSFTKEKHIIMKQFLKSYEKHSGAKLKEMGKFLLQSKKEAKIRRKKGFISI